MGRPQKQGLDYFSHDVDLSKNDKVEELEILYGNDGYAVYLKLLERIYKKGDRLVISEAETIQILSRNCNITIERFHTILNKAVKVGLFSAEEYANGILTSDEIKERVKPIFEKRKRMQEKYDNVISDAETMAETTIVKKSKVKKSKVKNIKPSGDFLNLIPDRLKTEDFTKAWLRWLKHRKEIRHKMTESTAEEQFEFLGKQPDPIACIKRSIEKGWQGLFEIPKNSDNQKTDLSIAEQNKIKEFQNDIKNCPECEGKGYIEIDDEGTKRIGDCGCKKKLNDYMSKIYGKDGG